MRSTSNGGTVRQIENLFSGGPLGAMSDGRLLERFADRDGVEREDAFAALVHRHGPMVLATCRRMLGDVPEADDAFQAVFLVLARKAHSLRNAEDVGGWLRVVAVRTGREARARSARLRTREGTPLHDRHVAPGVDPDLFELRAAFDEELERLPGRFREAVRLCELEGVPRRDAAERLGLAEGTLSSRLARGRSLLRDRLARRGLAVGLLGPALTSPAPASPLPEAALRLALEAIPTGAAPGTVSEAVASLAEGVLAMLALSRWKLLARAVLSIGALALGASLAWGYVGYASDSPIEPAVGEEIGPDAIRGVAVDESGVPIPGAEVLLDPYSSSERRGVTDANGAFAVSPAEGRSEIHTLLVRSEGGRVGVFVPDPKRVGHTSPSSERPLRITLAPGVPIDIQVTSADGQPIPGAMVEAVSYLHAIAHGESQTNGRARLEVPRDATVRWIVARKAASGLDYAEFGDQFTINLPDGVVAGRLHETTRLVLANPGTARIRVRDEDRRLAGVPVLVSSLKKPERRSPLLCQSRLMEETTDLDGVASFDWLPRSQWPLSFTPSVPPWRGDSIRVDAIDEEQVVFILGSKTEIRGRVAYEDGSPARGIHVHAMGLQDTNSAHAGGFFSNWARTAHDGTYSLPVPSRVRSTLWAQDDRHAPAIRDQVLSKPDSPVEGVDFTLVKGTTVRGRVTTDPDHRPAAGVAVHIHPIDRSAPLPESGLLPTSRTIPALLAPSWTDADGRFTTRLGPGRYTLACDPSTPPKRLTIADQAEVSIDFHVRSSGREFRGRLLDEKGSPAPGEWMSVTPVGGVQWESWLKSDAEGRFHGHSRSSNIWIRVTTADGNRAGVAQVGAGAGEVVVTLRPAAHVVGVLLDAKGQPVRNRELRWSRMGIRDGQISLEPVEGGSVWTDSSGRFASPTMEIGQAYDLRFPWSSRISGTPKILADPIRPKEPGTIDLGVIRLP